MTPGPVLSPSRKVVVLHGEVLPGAPEDEQEVLLQVRDVARALFALGYEPVILPFSTDVQRAICMLREIRPTFVFNLVESVAGQGQLIFLAPAILDYLRLPYTGARTEAMFLTSNKPLAKRILMAAGIPTPPWLTAETVTDDGILAGPCIIKSVWEHASVGLDEDAVIFGERVPREEMEQRLERLGGNCFLEYYIDGREFTVSLLAGENAPEVLPPAEIRFIDYPEGKSRIVCYRAKWDRESFEYRHTVRRFDFARQDEPLLADLARLARRCWEVFGLRGYARVDFKVDYAGQPWVLDVNANPCLSADSGFLAAAEHAGVSLREVVARIVHDSVSRQDGFRSRGGQEDGPDLYGEQDSCLP